MLFRIFKQGDTEKLILAITTSRFSTGAKFTASAITATFMKINAGGTALEIDTSIGASGVVVLSVDVLSKTGFHSAIIDFSAVTAKQYVVVFEATIDSVLAISKGFLDVSAERKKIADNIDEQLSVIAGLVLENHVEGDVVRDSNGNKLSSSIYLYDSAANAATHDKSTGLVRKYNMTASYTSNLMDLFKVVKA